MLGLFDVVGWAGGAVVAVAYVLVSTRRVNADEPLFQGLNILGAAMLGVASLHQNAMPSAGWNLVWVLIGLHSLATGIARRQRPGHRTYSTPQQEPFESIRQPQQTGQVAIS